VEILTRFIRDIKKYREYIINSIMTELSVTYAKSYLAYLWWVLDPLLYMFIYVFVVNIVLGRGGPQYPVFVFTALLFWRWTSSAINHSTNSILSKRNLLGNVYIPKFIFPLIKTAVDSVYFLFSILVLFLVLFVYKIPLTLHLFEFVPLFVVHFLFVFGLGLWMSHLGVYYYDVDRVLTFVLQAWYYLSPGLYGLDVIPAQYRFLFWFNPLTTTFSSSRNIFMLGQPPLYLGMFIWGVISILIIYFGLKKLYAFDRIYTKVF
jgi:ABC-type polysaccharide/polyol phosphate export permease